MNYPDSPQLFMGNAVFYNKDLFQEYRGLKKRNEKKSCNSFVNVINYFLSLLQVIVEAAAMMSKKVVDMHRTI
ncbi:hypothetical protein GCM10010913_46940 [Paenibacillus aceti]|uniref:Uncharacterized protein n=1 Tax=Paenibacillus aceti TaxID=1820010 RepID=A0ABQ1WAH8_9BACL|nr:hypothetical protein GCM10010913_46940 [Paenibacillus aceti]